MFVAPHHHKNTGSDSIQVEETTMEQTLAHILVVDDEAPIRTLLADLLRRRGFHVTTAGSGEEAVGIIEQCPFDLLLLDLRLPGLSGIELANHVRERHLDPAIIILTAYGSLDSAVEGMHLGVCDYLSKTASPQEVVARVASAIEQRQQGHRRQQLMEAMQALATQLKDERPSTPEPERGMAEGWIAIGDLEISTWRQLVRRGGDVLRLTPTEFRVLFCLAQHAGQVMTYEQIVQCAQGYVTRAAAAAEIIKPHIYHLRQKIEPNPDDPRYILTVRSTGYLLAAQPTIEQTTPERAGEPVAAG